MKWFKTIYPSLLWLAFIWILSSLPSKSLPSFNILGFDKLEHITIYAILGILFSTWRKNKNSLQESDTDNHYKNSSLLFMVLLLLAGLDEYHQIWIPGRSVSIYDLFANALGLSLGFWVSRKRK